MFLVKAKATTVVIGERVFSPVLATPFPGELPPDVADRHDLLLIEEVPDEQPKVDPGGLSASGTLETTPGAGGADTGAQGGPEGPGEGGSEAEASRVNPLNVDSDGDGHGALGPDGLPSIHHDGADTGAQNGPEGPGEGDAAGGPDPDPFADLSEGSNAGGASPASAPASAPAATPRTGGGGKGGRGGRK